MVKQPKDFPQQTDLILFNQKSSSMYDEKEQGRTHQIWNYDKFEFIKHQPCSSIDHK